MGIIATSRAFRFSTRPQFESIKLLPEDPTHVPPTDQVERPFTALDRHVPHKLSEIREVSGSSKATLARRYSISHIDGATSAVELEGDSTETSHANSKNASQLSEPAKISGPTLAQPASPRCEIHSLAPSALSLPLEDIPQRKSSMSALGHTHLGSRQVSLQDLHAEIISGHNLALSKGRADSPVRRSLAKGTQSSDALCGSPQQTFVRTNTPFYLLDNDNVRNPRLDMSVRLPSPLFVSGGTVEGQIQLKIDATANKKMRSKSLLISKLSVDVIGVEEVEDGRRQIFLSLATELFSSQCPPPPTLVVSQTPEKGPELYWQTRPSTATIPFCINLPLKLGPPPYSSRQASIRYLLCPCAVIKIGEKRSVIRQAWTIQMLTIHDPERALTSLPSPLLASDTITLTYKPVLQSVKVTAGLHRQTWVSGSTVFTDIHVVNNSDKTLKRIELSLEKSILWFSHSAAGTAEKYAKRLRIPDKIETGTVYKFAIRKNKQWEGVASQASELRTCELEIPKGHVTVGDGRFFEVRYSVKVAVVVTKSKLVSVQLPITIIHMNSLDILPNSVAQVAASIEAKRSMTVTEIGKSVARPPHTQGQAFSAARRQTIPQGKHSTSSIDNDMALLAHDLDHSPRRLRGLNEANSNKGLEIGFKPMNENVRPDTTACHQHLTLRPSCYHCHLLYTEHATKHHSDIGPRLPRLQVSTSGLGFSESEFEIPPDSPPRKVMLSEQERKMINQQRELGLQRRLSQQKPHKSYFRKSLDRPGSNFVGFKNVAAILDAGADQKVPSGSYSNSAARGSSQLPITGLHMKRNSLPPPTTSRRSRSRTIPEHMRASFSDSDRGKSKSGRPNRGVRSMDREDKYPMSGCNLVENDVFGPNKLSTDPRERMGKRRSVQAR